MQQLTGIGNSYTMISELSKAVFRRSQWFHESMEVARFAIKAYLADIVSRDETDRC